MGKEVTMERIRIWINSLVEWTPGKFRIYATNDKKLTSEYLPQGMYFFDYMRDVRRLVEQNALSTGNSDNGVDYENPTGTWGTSLWHEFGKSGDPVRNVSKSLTRGYHRYSFCTAPEFFPKYQRTGRYFFLEFYAAKYRTQIMEFRIKGNYTGHIVPDPQNVVQRIAPVPGLLDGYSSTELKGGYACKHLFLDYMGPHIKIRKSDSTEMDVILDADGVSGSYTTWIGSSVGTVLIWYDQSGRGNHAVAQGGVTFDYANKSVVLADDGYFELPDGTIPYNVEETAVDSRPYTLMAYHGATGSNNGSLISGGTMGSGSSKCNVLRRAGIGYGSVWWNRDVWENSDPIYTPNQVVVSRYVPSGGRDVYVPEQGVDKNLEEHTYGAGWHNMKRFKNTIGVTYGSDDTGKVLYWDGDIYTALIYEAALSHVRINGIAARLVDGT
jgi:hypothetical protein